jgi:hypothetical protein
MVDTLVVRSREVDGGRELEVAWIEKGKYMLDPAQAWTAAFLVGERELDKPAIEIREILDKRRARIFVKMPEIDRLPSRYVRFQPKKKQ